MQPCAIKILSEADDFRSNGRPAFRSCISQMQQALNELPD